METINVENELRDVVSRIICQVNLAAKQGRLDVNLSLEDALIPVLKEVFSLPRLVNLNAKQKNFPGIDLGDEHDRVAFQVTSTSGLEKVKKTLSVFIEHGFESNFDELFILILSEKQKSYSQDTIDKIIQGKFEFNVKHQIIDLSDILAKTTSLRLPAQKRVLHELKLILGDIDGYLQYTDVKEPEQKTLTTNLAKITFPDEVFIAEVIINFEETLKRARQELDFKKRRHSKKTLVRLAMVLNGAISDAWTFHEGKLFSFVNPEFDNALRQLIDINTIEPIQTNELLESEFDEYRNIVKELLKNSFKVELADLNVGFNYLENCFYFLPVHEEDEARKVEWIGKKKAIRTVFEKKMNSRNPDKVLCFKHVSFNLSFVNIGRDWYCLIVPSWLYTYNRYKKSLGHDKFLSKQKQLDTSGTVRNITRFIAFFLSSELDKKNSPLRVSQLEILECEYPDFETDEEMEDNSDEG
ncbi:SMEK domain-containing protein [Photorhabdus kleinii]|uniref:SMEK domain-containing protein n=1 Tax=Photorhabdus kleinii TaxID=768034 RepID=UPI0021D4D6CA|nr:SMEK domain-containing protein [Photorhabdus kleinii]MCT8345065.1 SMEK domain-containing protein [Photorhabdus kleinii]